MMKQLKSICLVSAAISGLLLAGCSDGKDGKDGATGPKGPSIGPVITIEAKRPKVRLLSYQQQEKQFDLEFELTNQKGALVNELSDIKVMIAEVKDNGNILLSPENNHGGIIDQNSTDAKLIKTEDGQYRFSAPLSTINPATDTVVWLQVGNQDHKIKLSQPVIVKKPDELTSTSTQACYGCHIDYATSPGHHKELVALDTKGNPDFVTGCLVCHNSKDNAHGGFAPKALSQIGHIQHKEEFAKDFSAARCETCHSKPIETFNFDVGCIDCHTDSDLKGAQPNLNSIQFKVAQGQDIRKIHGKLWKAQRKLAETHVAKISEPYYRDNMVFDTDTETFKDQGLCSDFSLFLKEGLQQKQLNVPQLLNNKTLAYVDVDIRSFFNGRSVGPVGSKWRRIGVMQLVPQANGALSFCYAKSKLSNNGGIDNLDLVANARAAFIKEDRMLIASSKVVDRKLKVVGDYNRTSIAKNCRNCHNVDSLNHYNDEGGSGCIFCHDAGDEIPTLKIPPAFGPAVHKRHGAMNSKRATGVRGKITAESTLVMLNTQNCVVCHEGGVELSEVQNMYLRARGFNNGDNTKMASPITSNCYGCHDSDFALSHMQSNGGEISADVTDGWYKLKTRESCVTCHEVGSSFGIEKYHNFERPFKELASASM